MPDNVKKGLWTLGFIVLVIVVIADVGRFIGVFKGQSMIAAITQNIANIGNDDDDDDDKAAKTKTIRTSVNRNQQIIRRERETCDPGFTMVKGVCKVRNEYDGHPLYDHAAKCTPGQKITIQVPHPTNPRLTREVEQECVRGTLPAHLQAKQR